MKRGMTLDRIQRGLAMAVLVLAVQLLLAGSLVRAANVTAATKGGQTNWRISLVQLRVMDQVPHTTWNNHQFHFFVLTLRMTNSGAHAADPYDDLTLVMRTGLDPGWQPLNRSLSVFEPMFQQAVRQYGGSLPWQVTQPGHTTTYTFVFGVRRDQMHLGLYVYRVNVGYEFLLSLPY